MEGVRGGGGQSRRGFGGSGGGCRGAGEQDDEEAGDHQDGGAGNHQEWGFGGAGDYQHGRCGGAGEHQDEGGARDQQDGGCVGVGPPSLLGVIRAIAASIVAPSARRPPPPAPRQFAKLDSSSCRFCGPKLVRCSGARGHHNPGGLERARIGIRILQPSVAFAGDLARNTWHLEGGLAGACRGLGL
jgi:hypothetical protein